MPFIWSLQGPGKFSKGLAGKANHNININKTNIPKRQLNNKKNQLVIVPDSFEKPFYELKYFDETKRQAHIDKLLPKVKTEINAKYKGNPARLKEADEFVNYCLYGKDNSLVSFEIVEKALEHKEYLGKHGITVPKHAAYSLAKRINYKMLKQSDVLNTLERPKAKYKFKELAQQDRIIFVDLIKNSEGQDRYVIVIKDKNLPRLITVMYKSPKKFKKWIGNVDQIN